MIIPEKRRFLAGGDSTLRLPSWLRAPLSLNEGARFYSVYEDLHPTKQSVSEHASEIILATIPPRYWADLWRIELVTYDRPGVLASVIALLNSHHLKVVLAEGSVHSSNLYNTMAFVVSAHDYNTLVDTERARESPHHGTLKTIDFMIKANLFDDIALNASGWPKVKIKRFTNFKRLHAEALGPRATRILDSRRQTLAVDPATGEGLIELPPETIGALRRKLGDDLAYMWNVDTKFRFIRAYVFSAAAVPAHYQFSIRQLSIGKRTNGSLGDITDAIAANGANIVKFQLRRGGGREADGGSRFDVTLTSNARETDWGRVDRDLQVRLGAQDAYGVTKKHAVSDAIPQRAPETTDALPAPPRPPLILSIHEPAMAKRLENLAVDYAAKERALRNPEADMEKDKVRMQELEVVRAKMAQIPQLRMQYLEATESRNTIFVSLAARQYRHYRDIINEVCIANNFTNILTGFDDDVRNFNSIRNAIFHKIGLSDAFLGIWTKDFEFKRPGAAALTYSPGVWMPFELGAAMIGKTHARILLENGSSPEILSPVSETNQGWFDKPRFREVLERYVATLRLMADGQTLS